MTKSIAQNWMQSTSFQFKISTFHHPCLLHLLSELKSVWIQIQNSVIILKISSWEISSSTLFPGTYLSSIHAANAFRRHHHSQLHYRQHSSVSDISRWRTHRCVQHIAAFSRASAATSRNIPVRSVHRAAREIQAQMGLYGPKCVFRLMTLEYIRGHNLGSTYTWRKWNSSIFALS